MIARPARSRPASSRVGRIAGPVAVLALVAAALASPALAAGTEFGTPVASATWGLGVTFREPAVLPRDPLRVEVVIDSGRVPGSFVSELPGQRAGAATFAYTLEAGTTGILPNTPFTARWRVTYPDGTVELGPPATVTYADTRFRWRTASGPVVRVHWYQGSDAFGQRALRIAEQGIAKASALLGVRETEPIDFFVYADQQAFYDALGPGTRENVGGQANADIRTLFALITPAEIDASWVSTVIPHELTHLVFDTAVRNPYHFPPRWFDEGLAVYLSQGYDASDRALVRGAVAAAGLMPLQALGGQFPTTGDRFALAYAESVSAIDFLVRTYGQDALVAVIDSYAGGTTDDEAFRTGLGVDVAGFESAWLADLDAGVPTRYGPRAAPPGPLPTGWSAAAAAPGSGAAGGSTGTGASPAAPPSPAANASDARPGAGEVGDALGGLVLAAALVAGVGTFYLLGRRRRRIGTTAETGAGADLDEATELGAEPAGGLERIQTSARPGDTAPGGLSQAPPDERDDVDSDGGPEPGR